MLQRAAQPAGFDAHDRIVLRVEIGIAAERVGGDAIRLNAFSVPRQGLVDDEGEEMGKLRRLAEFGTCNEPIERGTDFPAVWLLDDVAFEFIHGRERRGDPRIASRPLPHMPIPLSFPQNPCASRL